MFSGIYKKILECLHHSHFVTSGIDGQLPLYPNRRYLHGCNDFHFVLTPFDLVNPMYGTVMPLPSVRMHNAIKCQVKSKRTGLPCNNPAAFGTKACRMHGAHRTHARLSGENHPNYRHGKCTNKVKADYRAATIRLRELEKMLFDYGLIDIKSSHTIGRKPKS